MFGVDRHGMELGGFSFEFILEILEIGSQCVELGGGLGEVLSAEGEFFLF